MPEDLIRQAKVFAAQRDTTMNTLVRTLLEKALSADDRAQAAAARLLALAERGPYFMADPGSIKREDLHERR